MTYKISFNRMATGKLPQGDPRWAEFNDSFENLDLELIDIANAIYTGHAYTTWHNGRRKIENFICAQHVAVDLDSGDERSDIDHLAKHPLVRMYGGLIHTTPSHTPDSPRARVIFFLDSLIDNAMAYNAAASFLLSQFDGADAACKDASRFFYGAQNCHIALIDRQFPLSHLRHLFKQWKRLQPDKMKADGKIIKLQDRRREPVETGRNEDIGEFEKVKRALFHINPWSIDYNRWIGIIAALKREFGEAALPIAEQWAQGNDGEVEREWRRLRDDHANEMKLGTIYYLARKTG